MAKLVIINYDNKSNSPLDQLNCRAVADVNTIFKIADVVLNLWNDITRDPNIITTYVGHSWTYDGDNVYKRNSLRESPNQVFEHEQLITLDDDEILPDLIKSLINT